MKPKIGIDFQVAKAIFSIISDSRIKQDVSKKALSRDLIWIVGLISSGEFEGYTTVNTVEEIVKLIKNEIDIDRNEYDTVLEIFNSHNIQIYSNQNYQYTFEGYGEAGEYASLMLDLDINIFLTKSSEIFDRFILDNYLVCSKLKSWILTPSKFIKLISIQNKFINRSSGWKYSFRDIASLREVDALHQFERDVLPNETALPENSLRDWWQSYNAGIKAIFMGKQIMGVLSLWPLSDSTAKEMRKTIKDGTFKESQLDILSYENGRECKYWYIGGFYLHEALRSKGLSESFVDDLLLRSLTLWRAGNSEAFRPSVESGVEILAIPVNPYVETILKKYGFCQEQGTTNDGFPLYVKSVHSTYDLLF